MRLGLGPLHGDACPCNVEDRPKGFTLPHGRGMVFRCLRTDCRGLLIYLERLSPPRANHNPAAEAHLLGIAQSSREDAGSGRCSLHRSKWRPAAC